MKKGLIHLYTGEGKGKTTASLGLLLRAYGRGFRVVLVQFLKGRESGELLTLGKLPGVTVLRYARDLGFYKSASESDKAEMERQNNENLKKARHLVSDGLCDLLVLDEICAAYNNGSVDRALVDKLIKQKPGHLELVLTGRNAPVYFIEAADYVTEFIKRKHPYDNGIAAREGIEF